MVNVTENVKTLLYFAGIPHPVELTGCGDLFRPLDAVFAAWPHRKSGKGDRNRALVSLEKTPNGRYAISAPWLERPLESGTPLGALCNLFVDLVHAYFRCNGGMHCLHAAAARFAGGLAVFPNTNKSGKSTLAAALARSGAAIFGDDLLAITRDLRGMSFGVPPRLRMPLPDTEPELAEFVRDNTALEDRHYCYLGVEPAGMAAFGASRKIGAVVLLNRRPRGGAALKRAGEDEALDALAYQQFFREGEAMKILGIAREIVSRIPCWRLDYAKTADAVRALGEALGKKSGYGYERAPARPGGDEAPSLPAGPPVARKGKIAGGDWMRRKFVRGSGVTELERENGAVLVSPDGSEIFRIDRIGRAVWILLREPVSANDAADVLAEAFPGESPRKIRLDVGRLFMELAENGLIAPPKKTPRRRRGAG